MEKLIYLDTNIYLDYLENRTDKLRPLGEFAFQLIKRAIECEFKIIISSLIIDELEYNNYSKQIKNLINDLKELNKLIYTEETKDDEQKARNLKQKFKTSLNDTKHAVIAQRRGAKFLVTRNIKDYGELQNLVKIRFPENL